jgi:tRNA threonylcarbamoyladenosine biosynthesis protein TsaE
MTWTFVGSGAQGFLLRQNDSARLFYFCRFKFKCLFCYARNTMKLSLSQLPEFVSDFLKDISENYSDSGASNKSALLIALSGNLGAGKTTFTQNIAKQLGVEEKITSPTFVLMKKYSIDFGQFKNLIHIDAYRVESSDEISILRLPEIFADKENLVLLEWPEKIADVLPEEKITITFEVDGEEREIKTEGIKIADKN